MTTSSKKRRSYFYGHLCEWLTVIMFICCGYRLLERRFKTPSGEIDIVMRRGKLLAFIEVKARHDGMAAEAVTPYSQQRITDAARLYIAKHPEFANFDARFDVMLWHGLLPKHIKHAWLDERI